MCMASARVQALGTESDSHISTHPDRLIYPIPLRGLNSLSWGLTHSRLSIYSGEVPELEGETQLLSILII